MSFLLLPWQTAGLGPEGAYLASGPGWTATPAIGLLLSTGEMSEVLTQPITLNRDALVNIESATAAVPSPSDAGHGPIGGAGAPVWWPSYIYRQTPPRPFFRPTDTPKKHLKPRRDRKKRREPNITRAAAGMIEERLTLTKSQAVKAPRAENESIKLSAPPNTSYTLTRDRESEQIKQEDEEFLMFAASREEAD